MRPIVCCVAISMISCGDTQSVETELQSDNKVISESEVIEGVNLEAEAKLKPIIDAAAKNNFNLSKSCENDNAIKVSNGFLYVGSTQCVSDGLKVYLGSAELEYKVSSCQSNDQTEATSFFAIGTSAENEYYIVSNDEVKRPVFICK